MQKSSLQTLLTAAIFLEIFCAPGIDFGFKSLGKHISISVKFIYFPVSADLAGIKGTKFIMR